MSKILLVAAAAAGYVMGSRAGRGHYEIVRDKALELWQKPQVQEAASQATEFAKDTAEQVKDQAAESLDQNGGGNSNSNSSNSNGDEQSSGEKHSTGQVESSTRQNLYPGGAEGSVGSP